MSRYDKLIKRVLDGQSNSYRAAESLLKKMAFVLRIRGSHHVFSKPDYEKNVSLKMRNQLLPYQIRLLQEVLKDHGY